MTTNFCTQFQLYDFIVQLKLVTKCHQLSEIIGQLR